MTNWQILTAIELILDAGHSHRHPHRAGAEYRDGDRCALIGGGGLGTFVFQGSADGHRPGAAGAIPIVALAFSAAVVLDALVEVMDRARQ